MPPRDHSDSFDDERISTDPKADREGKEPVVDGKQYIVCGSPKCCNGSAQLFLLKQPPHDYEEEGTEVESLLTPQSQELLIDPSHWCLLLHTALALHEIIVGRLAGQKSARPPEGGTEDSMEDSDEEVFQDSDGIAPSS